MRRCTCTTIHVPKRIVLTGGPGAGKTALLEMVRQTFCTHVKILPEAAGIIFSGGFPREQDDGCKRAAQRAIFYVERELEAAAGAHDPAVVLCDRGTLDALAYWPGTPDEYFRDVGTTLDAQLSRYDAVIHLRTPAADRGYNQLNPLRTETAVDAMAIDARIGDVWAPHPRRFTVESSVDFLEKARQALSILRAELPECCRTHVVPAIDRSLLSGTASRPA